MRQSLKTPGKVFAAACALGVTNLLVSGHTTKETTALDEKGFSILTKLSGVSFAEAATQNKPNVVVMLADNLGYGDVGAYGAGEIRGMPTPNIDKLANEGLRFTQFLVEPGSTPSRAGLMTGRYSIRVGLSKIILRKFLNPKATTLRIWGNGISALKNRASRRIKDLTSGGMVFSEQPKLPSMLKALTGQSPLKSGKP
jgi:hypothetical protein